MPAETDREAEWACLRKRVREHPDRVAALRFSLDWPDLPLAAEIAETLSPTLAAVDPWQLERASRMLATLDPALALRLLHQAWDALDHARRHAEGAHGLQPPEPPWFANWQVSSAGAGSERAR